MTLEPTTRTATAALVDVPVGGASAAEVLGAVDAVLASDLAGVRVRLLLAEDHAARPALAELCAGDPRISLADPSAAPDPSPLHAVVPPSARPGAHTLAQVAGLVEGGGVVEVPVPGRLGLFARVGITGSLPGVRRLRVESAGANGAVRRVSARRVGLGSTHTRDRLSGTPAPRGSLAAERAEHLRHRARSATARSRLDRTSQLLARERMSMQYEHTRLGLLERRAAAANPFYWLGWRVRQAGRGVRLVVVKARALVRTARGTIRRAWRYAVDMARRRRSSGPRAPVDE